MNPAAASFLKKRRPVSLITDGNDAVNTKTKLLDYLKSLNQELVGVHKAYAIASPLYGKVHSNLKSSSQEIREKIGPLVDAIKLAEKIAINIMNTKHSLNGFNRLGIHEYELQELVNRSLRYLRDHPQVYKDYIDQKFTQALSGYEKILKTMNDEFAKFPKECKEVTKAAEGRPTVKQTWAEIEKDLKDANVQVSAILKKFEVVVKIFDSMKKSIDEMTKYYEEVLNELKTFPEESKTDLENFAKKYNSYSSENGVFIHKVCVFSNGSESLEYHHTITAEEAEELSWRSIDDMKVQN